MVLWWLRGKEFTCQCRFNPWVHPGEGNGNPLQHSCLGNSMDRGAWQATVHGVAKSWTQLKTEITQTQMKYNGKELY